MKRKNIISAAAVFIFAVILYLSGPEIDMKTAFQKPVLPAGIDNPVSLEKYIIENESKITDIRPGTEKKILWADSSKSASEYSIIYLHGFTASRMETEPVASSAASETGANIFYTRLKGHGHYQLNSQDNVNLSDWLYDASEALEAGKILGGKVIIISCSSGAALAAWLCSEYPEKISAVIMISPNFRPADSRLSILSHKWGPFIAKLIEGDVIGENETVISPQHAAGWSYIYKTEMLFPLTALLETVNKTDFSSINIPLLVFYSAGDKIVDHQKTKTVFSRWGAAKKQIIEVANPGDKNSHVISGDIFSPGTTEFVTAEIIKFISR